MKKIFNHIRTIRTTRKMFFICMMTVFLFSTSHTCFCAPLTEDSQPDVKAITPNEAERMLSIIPDENFWNAPEMANVRAKYPNLYVHPPTSAKSTKNTVFLTFDDGPSKNTEKILDVLKKEGAKATFFVVGNEVKKHPELAKRIIREGHAIGLHTNTHNYAEVYSSVDAYFNDLNECMVSIQKITSTPISIVRFPGGSQSRHNRINKQIQAELARRGFVYFDWNIDSGDAKTRNASSYFIAKKVLSDVSKKRMPVVLMHDEKSKKSTVAALEKIIPSLKDSGYKFDVLTNHIEPVHFKSSH